jgi:hypothetical protein
MNFKDLANSFDANVTAEQPYVDAERAQDVASAALRMEEDFKKRAEGRAVDIDHFTLNNVMHFDLMDSDNQPRHRITFQPQSKNAVVSSSGVYYKDHQKNQNFYVPLEDLRSVHAVLEQIAEENGWKWTAKVVHFCSTDFSQLNKLRD